MRSTSARSGRSTASQQGSFPRYVWGRRSLGERVEDAELGGDHDQAGQGVGHLRLEQRPRRQVEPGDHPLDGILRDRPEPLAWPLLLQPGGLQGLLNLGGASAEHFDPGDLPIVDPP